MGDQEVKGDETILQLTSRPGSTPVTKHRFRVMKPPAVPDPMSGAAAILFR
jgi:hypothetical protein